MRLLVFVVLALFAVTQAEDGARLLASKSLLNRYAVEGRDLTLQYNIYNVGSRLALPVHLDREESWLSGSLTGDSHLTFWTGLPSGS
uniref:Signal sequence receptor subunit 2 n=1 Tax=Molossus molossus TaxID=27622 RepID=A0A7J8CUA5_MOLMO|nr:signal sequence receptor subunit 2 [Molossus molossus]